mmetsp:Transcript_27990/g.46081  ORF Transcript_27990/g.46081 Transcript_27990/m.46081 type:complete len:101 (+) Transcript_27990:254-556(+)
MMIRKGRFQPWLQQYVRMMSKDYYLKKKATVMRKSSKSDNSHHNCTAHHHHHLRTNNNLRDLNSDDSRLAQVLAISSSFSTKTTIFVMILLQCYFFLVRI